MGKWFVRLVGQGGFDISDKMGIEAESLLDACSIAIRNASLLSTDEEILRFEITSPSGERKILSAQGYIDRLSQSDTPFYKGHS